MMWGPDPMARDSLLTEQPPCRERGEQEQTLTSTVSRAMSRESSVLHACDSLPGRRGPDHDFLRVAFLATFLAFFFTAALGAAVFLPVAFFFDLNSSEADWEDFFFFPKA